MTAYMICGIDGSGKGAFREKLIEQRGEEDVVIDSKLDIDFINKVAAENDVVMYIMSYSFNPQLCKDRTDTSKEIVDEQYKKFFEVLKNIEKLDKKIKIRFTP